MTNAAQASDPGASLTHRIAAELRAELARHRVSGRRLARELGVAHTWAAQRLNGTIALSSDDVERIACVLGVDPAGLWGQLQPQGAYRPMTNTRIDTMIPCSWFGSWSSPEGSSPATSGNAQHLADVVHLDERRHRSPGWMPADQAVSQ